MQRRWLCKFTLCCITTKSLHVLYADALGQEQHWRVPGVAQARLDGQLAPKQLARLPAKTHPAQHPSRRSTAPARCSRREAEQARSRDSSQEKAERRAAKRAAKKAAQVEALEREWRVQQVAGELGRQAELLERHRYLVAKYGVTDALDQPNHLASPAHQVRMTAFAPGLQSVLIPPCATSVHAMHISACHNPVSGEILPI